MLPRPADLGAAERLRERFAALGQAWAAFAARPDAAALLDALGGNSPYLSDLALREPGTLRRTFDEGAATVVAASLAALAAVPPAAPRAQVASAVRRAKREVALAVAVADIAGTQAFDAIVGALTSLAEAALRLACAHLLLGAHARGELRLPDPADPARGSGLAVLGMGKLGARELNYSSDVDLVLLYDPDAHPYHADGLRAAFTRLARDLVTLMEARDADGYVFRVDLRLRPDPAATPPAVSLPAAIAYYESMGQNWERAAMTKARPVAGDAALGTQFLDAIRPFVWRRGLDFAALADIHAMKRRVESHKGTTLGTDGPPAARLLGHDLKLGQGGIREIEFLAQTLQLVWGGRDPSLRDPTTTGALRRLHRAGKLSARATAGLTRAYRYLRTVEHRLQMVADRQTHSLPSRMPEFERFAVFMGDDADGFAQHTLWHMGRVLRHYAEVFEQVPAAPAEAEGLDLSGVGEAPTGTLDRLRALGFAHPDRIVAALRGWQAGRVRALRSARARELMDAVLPGLLAELGRQREPDAAFARLDALVTRLPAGVPILSTFQRNPAVVTRVAAVLGAAPLLADHLAQVPAAVEGLLGPPGVDPDPAAHLDAQLADARDLEEAVIATRRFVRGEEFRLGVAQLEGWLDVDAAGLARTALADAALAALLPRVLDDHARRYGRVRGGAVAVVALGKAGSREMMAGSDLDLMLVHSFPPQVVQSEGARPIAAQQWFTRAAHAVVAALTAPGAEGPLYHVDMRLRPSGNKGPVAVSLPAFRAYHAGSAWTWERMALTRARIVAGPPAMRARVDRAVAEALRTGDPTRVRADAAAMRARMLRDLPASGPWDVKLRPGGLVEVEFIAQALQLLCGVRSPVTRHALALLAEHGALTDADARLLIEADRFWRTVQSMLRITVGPATTALPPAAAEALLRATGAVGLAALEARMDRTARAVRAAFVRIIGEWE
jgi:glutamate-ammonia-ligase adenylyltransferase